jgi:hypothetical protein
MSLRMGYQYKRKANRGSWNEITEKTIQDATLDL